MTRTNIFILIGLTVVVVAAAAMMRSSRSPVGEPVEGPYFPGLLDKSNEVAKVLIKDGDATTTIIRDGESWTIEEKANYPASLDRVRELVVGLARLQRIEGKTSKPERYARLGLEDIGDPGSASTLLQLIDSSGGTLAVLVVGNEKMNQSVGPRRQLYVRSPGDPRAWLVEGQMPDTGATANWMDTSILGADAPAFRSVSVSRGGETLTVSRESADNEVYEIQGLSAGEEIDSQYAVNQVARSLRDLEFEDVRPAADDQDESGDVSVIAESFDGIRIMLTLRKEDDRYFGRFEADYRPAEEADEAIREKTGNWNGLWRNWEYLLPNYAVENIVVARQDLVRKESETKPAE